MVLDEAKRMLLQAQKEVKIKEDKVNQMFRLYYTKNNHSYKMITVTGAGIIKVTKPRFRVGKINPPWFEQLLFYYV